MKTTLILVLRIGFFLFSCITFGQTVLPTKNPINIVSDTIEILNTISEEKDLVGSKYIVPYEIVKFKFDPEKMQLFLIAKAPKKSETKPQFLILYDLIKNKIIWSKIAYASDFSLIEDKVVIQGFKKSWKSFGLDRLSGDIKWQKDTYWYYPLITNNKYIAFTGRVTAFDLNTGQDLWSRKIKIKYGWREREVINGDLLASADGLHKFNLSTGEGWSVEMAMGKKDVGEVIGAAIAGVHTTSDKLVGLSSNILKQNDRVYFSAMNDLSCFDYNSGKEIWHIQLKERRTGDVVLFLNKEKLLLINKGNLYREGESESYGHPYFAIFDKITGQEIAWKEIDDETLIKNVAYDENNGFYLLSEVNLMFYDYNGKLNCKTRCENFNDYPENIAFCTYKPLYTTSKKDNNQFQSLNSLMKDSTSRIVQTSRGFSIFDKYCTTETTFQNEQVKRLFAKTDDLYFLNDNLNDDKSNPFPDSEFYLYILSNEKKLIGEYKLPGFSRYTCNVYNTDSTKAYLFYFNDSKSFSLYPLSQFKVKMK